MVRTTLIVICAVLLMGQIVARQNAHDFGKVKRYGEVTHEFEIENTTPGPLIVGDIEAG